MIWGSNMAETRIGEYDKTIQAVDKGTKLIVIDPRQIDITTKADISLQLRPGSDLALALGMINVIINEKLFDETFVDHWTNGFDTPSGRVELYSSQLKDWGLDPLPIYYEPPETPYSDPELSREYPLIYTTWKSEPYRHSEGRQIASLRNRHPEPVILIHPKTADRLVIQEGDWVYIETKRGRIKQKAALNAGIDPRVVGIDYAWWFPEKGISSLYEWNKSNTNILTDDKPSFNRELGSTNLRSMLCKVYKI